MKQDKLDAMSVKDLTQLQSRVTAQIEVTRNREAAAIRGKVEELARSAGLRIEEVLGTLRSTTKRGPARVAPKYRDPKTGTTWTGRGRTPHWMPSNKSDWSRVAL